MSVSNLRVDTEEGPYLIHLLRDIQDSYEKLELARHLLRGPSNSPAPVAERRDTPALTPRQLEVLTLLSAGKSTREIARELYLSEVTARNHISALLRVMGVRSRLEALAKAREVGILAG